MHSFPYAARLNRGCTAELPPADAPETCNDVSAFLVCADESPDTNTIPAIIRLLIIDENNQRFPDDLISLLHINRNELNIKRIESMRIRSYPLFGKSFKCI